jgi:hypothetical protein
MSNPETTNTAQPVVPAQMAKSPTDDFASFVEQRHSAAEASAKRHKSSTDELAQIEAELRKIRALAKAQEREYEEKRRDASSAVGALAARVFVQVLQGDVGLRNQIDARLRLLESDDVKVLKKLSGLADLKVSGLAKLLSEAK